LVASKELVTRARRDGCAVGVRKYDLRKVSAPPREAMQQAVMNRMSVFASAGKA